MQILVAKVITNPGLHPSAEDITINLDYVVSACPASGFKCYGIDCCHITMKDQIVFTIIVPYDVLIDIIASELPWRVNYIDNNKFDSIERLRYKPEELI